ncbi:hypothetical protein B7494_g1735 [Chlorociboria aeruginascens]|nr:hypothetical protein B7494_g1735 [Chlorociboria aeruginascens]
MANPFPFILDHGKQFSALSHYIKLLNSQYAAYIEDTLQDPVNFLSGIYLAMAGTLSNGTRPSIFYSRPHFESQGREDAYYEQNYPFDFERILELNAALRQKPDESPPRGPEGLSLDDIETLVKEWLAISSEAFDTLEQQIKCSRCGNIHQTEGTDGIDQRGSSMWTYMTSTKHVENIDLETITMLNKWFTSPLTWDCGVWVYENTSGCQKLGYYNGVYHIVT